MTQAIYRVKANELDVRFLEQLKADFGDKEIQIIISESDETEYLLSSEVNKKRLLTAIANVKAQKNLVEMQLEN